MRLTNTDNLRVPLLGVNTDAQRLDDAVKRIIRWADACEHRYVSLCPVYTIMRAYDDDAIRVAINGADMIAADGMPVVWFQRRSGAPWAERVYGPDLMHAMFACIDGVHLRHYFFGGSPDTVAQLITMLEARTPEIIIAGSSTPDIDENAQTIDPGIIQPILDAQPNIVWVGLGSPKQDLWMARYSALLPYPLIGVGAAFEFLAGTKAQAPLWVRQHGLEWLFRLVSEPRRLWRRYLLYNPRFAWLIAQQFLSSKLLKGTKRVD